MVPVPHEYLRYWMILWNRATMNATDGEYEILARARVRVLP